ncbi:MAG: murein biosynthesis integral membrane protein MurJ [Sphaerochaetaceae bacterium]|jgi:putative peptidoglycan lipid II flippase|nr:murein biosynthesis integral membrane protein MurJ [Sphaerochaetaceae bacterium]MDD2406605.1 murein biosynthesis integral membrane protein MurJ [Sphaerochaetaceae bacterium]MDD4260198.1 murein biosynthesis integral membrane protein MurJ [Sphaerochaetaceae bacterium]MDD4840948.1 murein biosynthesis integral membrane protein MurJ [Sphaerochaetaceae bacterium]NLO60475.1 murein biosynthesis integral membrane protein MurJ [Spirochaetales bacterium]
MADSNRTDKRKHMVNSTIVMCCTLLSRLLGIVKARVIAVHFGMTGVADVINFTFNVPNNFRKLFAEGALNSAYIPVFAASIATEDSNRSVSRALLARIQGFQLLIFSPMVLLTWFFREPIIRFLSDFTDSGQIRLSADLLFYFMIFLLTISLSSIYQGVLQCHGSFFVASAAPLSFSLSVIASVTLLSQSIGAFSMAVGTITGGILQGTISLLGLRRFGYGAAISFRFNEKQFKQVMRAWMPVTLGAVVQMLGQQVAFFFASTLPTGSITAFSNAIIFWQTPYGIFFTAIATVYFPALVTASKTVDHDQAVGNLVREGLANLATFLIPSAILLVTLRHETVAVILQGGLFTVADTLLTAKVLLWYAVGMLAVAWFGFLQRVNFALLRFRHVLSIVTLVIVLDIGLTWIMVANHVGIEALSIANSIAYFVGVIVFAVTSKGLLTTFRLRQFLLAIGKIGLANLPLVICGIMYTRIANNWWISGTTLPNVLYLVLLYLAAILIVFVSYRIARIEFLDVLRKRRSRSSK